MARRVKAELKDVVMHNGKRWTVIDRVYEDWSEQSYYQLRRGVGRSITKKWARSDAFAVV